MEVLKEDIVLYYWEFMSCCSSGAGQRLQQGAREQEYRNRRSGLGGAKDGDFYLRTMEHFKWGTIERLQSSDPSDMGVNLSWYQLYTHVQVNASSQLGFLYTGW